MTATADAVSAQRVSAGAFAPSDATVGFGFDFYGVGLIVTSGSTALVDGVARDFEYFAGAPPASRIVVRGHASPPPWERIPARLASMVTPNAVTYDDGGLRYNDYQRRALAIYDFATEHGDVWSEDADLLYEIVYLMALSRVGERHDLLGIHRLHALGVAIDGRAALVLLPEAGGKSTLALELLRRPEIRLLSDDTPLARGDRVLAFPTRIGVRAGGVAGVAPADLRTVRRRERGPKTVIDFRHFRDRVIADARPAAVIVGARHGGERSWIEPLARRRAVAPLLVNMVFGLGLPQVVEYFLRGGAAELLRKSAIMRSRLATGARLLRAARTYRLVMGRDVPAAAAAIASVLR